MSLALAETFEEGWSGNHGSISRFEDDYVWNGSFDGGVAEVERFSYDWKDPVLEGALDVGGGEGAGFTVGQKILDISSQTTAYVKDISTDTITFTYIDIGSSQTFGQAGADLASYAEGYQVLGTGTGAKKQFGSTIADTPILERHVAIFFTIGGMTKALTDNGVGTLLSVDALLDEAHAATVDYSTGVVNFTLLAAPDVDTSVYAIWYYGAVLGTVASPLVLTPGAPWNNSSADEFTLGSLASGVDETFNSDWSSNETSVDAWTSVTETAASFDSGTPEDVEDFEEQWYSNEDAQDSFGGGDLTAGTFDSPPVSAETFSGTWTDTLSF